MAAPGRSASLTENGLNRAEVRERVQRGDVNRTPKGPSRTTADIVRANVLTRFNFLLAALVLVVMILVQDPRDALFGVVLVANTTIGITQELRAKATLDRLAVLTSPRARVVRAGSVEEIAIEEIVLDDVIEIRSGDQLPVDGTVLSSRGLEIDESLLTGESDPVLKQVGANCLSGSFVVAGSGRFVATRVGERAYAAALATEAKEFTLVRSELRTGIDWILAAVGWAVAPVIAILVWSSVRAESDFTDAVQGAVAGAVGMVPQGLVLLTSIAFAVGVVRLGRNNVLIQELPAIEGLARVDTVCFDKTGTLTEGRLVVQSVYALGDSDPNDALGALGAVEPHPNATLQAIIERFDPPEEWHADQSIPFSSARKWSAASFRNHGTWVLGAPDVVAPKDGDLLTSAAEHASLGRRVLLLASTELRLQAERLPRGLTPEALVILGDQVRPDAAETLRYFAEQGVHTKVISGDHPHTVAAIAREVGVPGAQAVVDARDLPTDQEGFAAAVEEGTVFGRVTPHQKQAMVRALQSNGHVVAMTGDGVNDVLALKDSDVGVAIGTGSSASRAVAQVVLIDGSFAALPGVVGEGRRVIANIERVANLFVTKTVYAIFIALAIGLAGQPFPFLPRHLTLVGSVTVGIPAFALALAPSARRARKGFLVRVMRFALPTGLAAGIATFGAYQLAIAEDVTLPEARTTATLVLAALGLFALGIVARPLLPWKKGLIWSMAGILVVLLLAQPSQDFFDLDLPRLAVLLAAIGIVALTGTAMLGTLRAIGWIRAVPEFLQEHPPDPSLAWRTVRDRVQTLLRRPSQPVAAEAFVSTELETEPPEQATPDEGDEIDWFDPDLDPVEFLNEPPPGSGHSDGTLSR